jgi:hypothetical protein
MKRLKKLLQRKTTEAHHTNHHLAWNKTGLHRRLVDLGRVFVEET